MSGENTEQTPVEQQEPTAADFAADDAPEPQPNTDNAVVEGDEGEEQPESEAQDGDDSAPEFWSADAKALWSKLKDQPELRAALKDMNAKERRAVATKFEEASERAKEAEAAKAKASADIGHVAQWFEQNGPAFLETIKGRWAGWTPEYQQQLATDEPAKYVQLKAMYDADMVRAHTFAQKGVEVRTQQAQAQANKFAAERAASHAKLAEEMPAEFGAAKAEATYKTLSTYLMDQGVPAERIPFIHEPFVVKTVLKAYKYDQLQAKMKASGTQPANGQQSATATPRRIPPGAQPTGGANRQSDAERQAMEALRSGERSSVKMAAAFR